VEDRPELGINLKCSRRVLSYKLTANSHIQV